MKTLNQEFVAMLKKQMERRHLTAYRLASLTGLNASSIQRILNEQVSPTLETAGKILIGLGGKDKSEPKFEMF